MSDHIDRLRAAWLEVRSAYPWDKAAEVFSDQGWVYGWKETEHVPGRSELEAACDSLFSSCLELHGADTWASSGRFIVRIVAGQPVIESEAIDGSEYREHLDKWRHT